MKKLFKSLFAIVLCVLTCVSFAGCNNKTWSKTTNDNSKVESNGGSTVYHDGWLYFINGTKDVNKKNNSGKTVQAGIYRAETDKNGNVLYKETTDKASDDKEEVKEFKNIEPVVKSLTGFKDGSLFIFGDYLYYVTPSKAINDEGDMLTGKLAFYRYDLKNKNSQHLFTTKASDDTVSYTYYKQGQTDLYLVVYEKTSATITSLKMGDKVKKAFVEEEVKSVAFSNTNGDVVNVGTNVTDCYIYYTKDAEENEEGNRVYRNLPNGQDEKVISKDEAVSLVAVEKGYLIYQKDSLTYAEKIQNTTTQLSFDGSNVVYYGEYENVIYLEENNKLGALIYDNGIIRKIVWDVTKSIDENVESMQPIFDEFDPDDKVLFIGLDGDYLIYQLSQYIYKVKVLNIGLSDEIDDVKLSETKMDEVTDGSLLALEIVNGYVYGMYTDSEAKITYMYRIRIQTPKEAGEVDEEGKAKEVGAAEFIGVKQ